MSHKSKNIIIVILFLILISTVFYFSSIDNEPDTQNLINMERNIDNLTEIYNKCTDIMWNNSENLEKEICKSFKEPTNKNCSLPEETWRALGESTANFGKACNLITEYRNQFLK